MASFNPSTDIPPLTGKIILITGGTAGLGKNSVLALVPHKPAHIYFTGRSQSRAQEVIEKAKAIADVPVTFLQMDLGSAASIKSAIQPVTRVDILMANAGIMAVPASTTSDGYEIQFGTNHLGHAILIHHLLPNVQRIVLNSSLGAFLAPGIKFDTLKSPQDMGMGGRWYRYGQSKLANILYAAELARRYPNITSVSIHPGVIKTDLVNSLGFFDRALINVTSFGKMISEEDGIKNQLWAAITSELENGEFYEPVGVVGKKSKDSTSIELAQKLWEWTEEQIKALT